MKQLSEIRQEISQLMRRVEDVRIEKMQAYNKGLLYTFGTLAIGLILLFMGLQGAGAMFIIGIVLAIASIVIYYFVAHKRLNEFRLHFKSTVLTQFVQMMYPGVNYEPKGMISQSDFNASQLFNRSFNIYKGEDYFEGSIDQTRFQLSELNVKKRTRRHRSSGSGSSSSTTTIFDGIYVVLNFEQSSYGETYILPDTAENLFGSFGKMIQKSLGSLFQKGNMIYLEEHPEFEKQFVVYSTDETESLRILTQPLLEAICELRNKWGARPHLSFIGNNAYVAIKTRKNLFKVNPRKSLIDDREEILEGLFDELALCMSIVEEINNQQQKEER